METTRTSTRSVAHHFNHSAPLLFSPRMSFEKLDWNKADQHHQSSLANMEMLDEEREMEASIAREEEREREIERVKSTEEEKELEREMSYEEEDDINRKEWTRF